MDEKNTVNRSELARLMLQWESKKRDIADLETVIQELVMELAETVQTGYVRAVYSEGRGRYNYEAAATNQGFDQELKDKHTTPQPDKVDWRSICKDLELSQDVLDLYFTPGQPSVTIKLT